MIRYRRAVGKIGTLVLWCNGCNKHKAKADAPDGNMNMLNMFLRFVVRKHRFSEH